MTKPRLLGTRTSVGAILSRRTVLRQRKEAFMYAAKRAKIWEMESVSVLPPPKILPPFPAPPPPPPKLPGNFSRQPSRRQKLPILIPTVMATSITIPTNEEPLSGTFWPPLDQTLISFPQQRPPVQPPPPSPPPVPTPPLPPAKPPPPSPPPVPKPPLAKPPPPPPSRQPPPPPSRASAPQPLPSLSATYLPALLLILAQPILPPSGLPTPPFRQLQNCELGHDLRETSVSPTRCIKKNRRDVAAQQRRKRQQHAQDKKPAKK